MRVWVVSHAYVATVNQDKLRVLAMLPGIELTLLAPAVWPAPFGQIRFETVDAPYRVVLSRVLGGGRIGVYLYRDGLRELRRARPDVVHAELEPWSLAALQCVLAARGLPVVLFTWENLEGPRRWLPRVVERLVLRRVAFVIAGNNQARARMLRRGVPSGRIAVIPQFGVDVARYASGEASRVRGGLALRSPVVGYVGRLVPEKGIDLLIDALEPLDASLLLVGDGPARPELEQRLAAWPSGRAVLARAVDHAAVPDYLACLDTLVLPSRTTPSWAEQFGHVLIEAMAAGVAVIGSSSGAIPEVIGHAGLVFSEGDVDSLRQQLAWVLGDDAFRKTLVARGRERVRQRYTHAVIAAAQREIYARLRSG